jgi:hypothetical protein
MVQVGWEFVVRVDAVEAFERAYGPDGASARLFAGYQGYRGTALLRDVARPRVYLTVDSWDSAEQRDAMLARAREEYERLDRTCAHLAESETEIGVFAVANAGSAARPVDQP